MKLHVTIDPDDHKALGFKTTMQSSEMKTSAMADTGCQSCLAGLRTIRQLGLDKNDLIPVSMRMHAANNNTIKILGAVVLRFSGKSSSGHTLETRQLTYITDSTDTIFLSREACEELGMISPNFPRIGEVNMSPINPSINGITHEKVLLDKLAACGCLQR